MISATSSFLAANALNQKKPILVLLLRNCPYAFATGAIAGSTVGYPDLKAGALCGAFTDSGGNVIQPIAIGASPTTLIVPAGATQLHSASTMTITAATPAIMWWRLPPASRPRKSP